MKRRPIWGAAVLGLIVGSCDDDDHDIVVDYALYHSACIALCDHSRGCDAKVDEDTCREDCYGASSKLNDGYLVSLNCTREQSCDEFLTTPKKCEQDARAATEVSSVAQELCDTLVASGEESACIRWRHRAASEGTSEIGPVVPSLHEKISYLGSSLGLDRLELRRRRPTRLRGGLRQRLRQEPHV